MNKNRFLLLFLVLASCVGHAEAKRDDQIPALPATANFNSPLRELKSFAFCAFYDAKEEKNAEKVRKLIVEQLQKVGRVIQLKKGDGKEQIDVTGLASGAFLNFEIKNVALAEAKQVPVVNASLRLSTSVEIKKTAVSCFADTWSASCFLEGTFAAAPEKIITKSLENLLAQFGESYRTANPDQKEGPTFYLYMP